MMERFAIFIMAIVSSVIAGFAQYGDYQICSMGEDLFYDG